MGNRDLINNKWDYQHSEKVVLMPTYNLVGETEMVVEALHGTTAVLVESSVCLYLSLFLMMSSSLELIASILLERLCRTRICVVNPAINLTMARVQLGYLQGKKPLYMQSYSTL